MVSMRDLAIDLINEAKGSQSASQKLYGLEQIKEIVLHRDLSLMNELIPEVMSFIVEKSIPIRKFLIKFAGEAMKLDIKVGMPSFLSLLDFMTSSDAQDNLLVLVANELHGSYSDIVIQLSNLPLKTKSTSLDPSVVWNTFRASMNHLLSIISSDRSDMLKISCIKLAESVILFGLPPPPPITDPRLARAMKNELSVSTTKTKNAEDIPLHHSFINRTDLVQEAEDLYSKMLLWSGKNGPQDYPFGTTMVSLLGEILASIAVSRPKKGPDAAKAITAMIQSKSSLCSSMTASERERLARFSHRLIRISVAFNDPDGSIPKLRAAVIGLEALGVTSSTTESKKRPLEEEEEEDEEQKKMRLSAVAAVDALENQRKNAQDTPSTLSTSSSSYAASSQGPTNINPVSVISTTSTETELASDLTVVLSESAISTQPLMMVQPVPHNAISSDVVFNQVSSQPEVYAYLSLQSFQRTLDSFQDIKSIGEKEAIIHLQLSVRSAISLATELIITQDQMNCLRRFKPDVSISIISSIPSNISKIYSHLPLSVMLPRSIWLLVSFVLNPSTRTMQTGTLLAKKDPVDVVSEKLLYLQSLCQTLYSRYVQNIYEESNGTLEMYNSTCYVITSRLLQNTTIRTLAYTFLTSLPVIPDAVYTLLQVLLYSGTKAPPTPATSGPSGRQDKNQIKSKNRGTRTESLHILNNLAIDCDQKALNSDELDNFEEYQERNIPNKPLHILLWCAVCDDFEYRSKAVTTIMSDLINSERMKETIVLFALQSASTLVGQISIQELSLRDNLRHFKANEDVKEDIETRIIDKEQPDAMEVDATKEETENIEPDPKASNIQEFMSLCSASESYDGGKMFDGSFEIARGFDMSLKDQYDVQAFEAYLKRKLHLLFQLCLSDYTLLMSLMDLYAVSVLIANSNTSSSAEEKSNDESSAFRTTILQKLIVDELTNIIPVIAKQNRIEDIFRLLMSIDPVALPLLEIVQQLLLSDLHIPASLNMIELVESFASKMFDLDNQTNIERSILFTIPLLGGYTAESIENIHLPKLVKYFSEKPDVLRSAYQRIVLARPPALSKVNFVLVLHRFNYDSHDIKQKVYLDSISACLSDVNTFSGEVIRDALMQMVEDEVLPVSLVRTALLASKAHNEVKKYVLMEFIPKLIKMKIWLKTPVAWEGIKHCIKTYATVQTGQNSEPTLRSILGLPGAQMKAILAAAPLVKASLSKLLKVLSTEEKEEVLSGRWAGIESEDGVLDSEKTKIVKELMMS